MIHIIGSQNYIPMNHKFNVKGAILSVCLSVRSRPTSCPRRGRPWSDEGLERRATDGERAAQGHASCQGLQRQNSLQGM